MAFEGKEWILYILSEPPLPPALGVEYVTTVSFLFCCFFSALGLTRTLLQGIGLKVEDGGKPRESTLVGNLERMSKDIQQKKWSSGDLPPRKNRKMKKRNSLREHEDMFRAIRLLSGVGPTGADSRLHGTRGCGLGVLEL